jgi:hypothetical protein
MGKLRNGLTDRREGIWRDFVKGPGGKGQMRRTGNSTEGGIVAKLSGPTEGVWKERRRRFTTIYGEWEEMGAEKGEADISVGWCRAFWGEENKRS